MRIVERYVPRRGSGTAWSGAVVLPPQTIYIHAVAARNTGVPTAPPPQTPQCGGSEGSRGPLPLGKRHCSSRPYTGADHLILIQTCTSPGRGPYRVFCRGPKLEVMLLARNRPQADAVSRQTERLLPKTYSNRMFSQWCSQGGGAVGAAPPP